MSLRIGYVNETRFKVLEPMRPWLRRLSYQLALCFTAQSMNTLVDIPKSAHIVI
jgi:hypothetical protein